MMSQTQTIGNKQGGFNLFSIATVIMMLLYTLPQVVFFIRNDMMAIIVTVYYALFISRHVSPAIVLKILLIAVPYALLFWFNGFPGNVRLGFVLPLMTLWTLVMPCFAIIAVVKRKNPAEQKFILIATGICLLYVFSSTFRALSIDPLIMRETGAEDNNASYLVMRMSGAGGYGFAYAIGGLFIATWCLFRHIKRHTYLRIIVIAIITACGVLIVKAQFATLLFISIFGVALYYFITANTTTKRIRVVALAVIAILASQTLIIMGASLFSGEVLRYKFSLIYDGIWGTAGVENISGDRSQLQLGAFDLFLSSPIWGCSGVVNLEEYSEAHSTILGVMASTGLIGLISYIMLFYSSCKKVLAGIPQTINDTKLYIPILIYYLLFALLNPVQYAFECAWMIFFVVPLMFATLSTRIKK